MTVQMTDRITRDTSATILSTGGTPFGWRFHIENGRGTLYGLAGSTKLVMSHGEAMIRGDIADAREALDLIERAVNECYPKALLHDADPSLDVSTSSTSERGDTTDAEFRDQEVQHVSTP